MNRFVEEVFVTEGVPQFTFIQPPNFSDVLIDIRRDGKPVIIEGQSGTGKTTCVKKIIEKLGKESRVNYLTPRHAAHITKILNLPAPPIPLTFLLAHLHPLHHSLHS